jgi:hypothetical protein
MPPAKKVVVRLTADRRDALDRLRRTGSHPAAVRRRAAIRVRQQFAADGLDATLHRKKPTGRQYRKLGGEPEARLVALACSAAPEGQARWTMKLLAERLVGPEVVGSIDPATVWRALQKATPARGSSSSGSSRPRRAGRSSRRWRT